MIRVFKRKVRFRGGTMEIVVPPPLLDYVKTTKNRKKRLGPILMWINKHWVLEVAGFPVPYDQINGIALEHNIHPHGGSWAFSIPVPISDMLEGIYRIKTLGKMEISVNKNGHLEYEPISK